MFPHSKFSLKSKQVKSTHLRPSKIMRLVSWLMLAAVLLSACRTGKPSATPTSAPVEPSSSATPAFEAVDEGAPLPPMVLDVQPAGGREMPLDGAVEVKFDQSMDPGATASAWQVLGPKGDPVQGELAWSDARTLRFTPSGGWESGAVYRASLGLTALSAAGEPIHEPLSFEFSTVGELQVNQVFPANSAQDVAGDAVITRSTSTVFSTSSSRDSNRCCNNHEPEPAR